MIAPNPHNEIQNGTFINESTNSPSVTMPAPIKNDTLHMYAGDSDTTFIFSRV